MNVVVQFALLGDFNLNLTDDVPDGFSDNLYIYRIFLPPRQMHPNLFPWNCRQGKQSIHRLSKIFFSIKWRGTLGFIKQILHLFDAAIQLPGIWNITDHRVHHQLSCVNLASIVFSSSYLLSIACRYITAATAYEFISPDLISVSRMSCIIHRVVPPADATGAVYSSHRPIYYIAYCAYIYIYIYIYNPTDRRDVIYRRLGYIIAAADGAAAQQSDRVNSFWHVIDIPSLAVPMHRAFQVYTVDVIIEAPSVAALALVYTSFFSFTDS